MAELRPNLVVDCARNLALTVSEIETIAATAPRRYYVWKIAKRSGGERTVCHPAHELKAVQQYFLSEVLKNLPVHSAATAYVKGSSIKRNASVHAASRVMLKLDFTDFFNSLKVANWEKYVAAHFPEWSVEETNFSSRILFWGNGSYTPLCLAIGAPTSPLISNVLLFDFDAKLAAYAKRSNLLYTRYADDITISSREYLEKDEVISVVTKALASARYCRLKLNLEKTTLASNKYNRRVTGLIITPDGKVSLGRERKRLISAMVHRQWHRKLDRTDRPKLAGLIAFAQDVEPSFVLMLRRKYSSDLIDWLLKWGTRSEF